VAKRDSSRESDDYYYMVAALAGFADAEIELGLARKFWFSVEISGGGWSRNV